MKHTVRRVLPGEYYKYRAHLTALDTDSKLLRFGFSINDATLNKLCDGFEQKPEEHILFCVEDDMLNFIAVGHIAKGNTMELAFSVLKEHQGQGLGDALMKRCIRYCRTHKILSGYMVCLSRNNAIKHLAIKNRMTLHADGSETEANIEFAEPRISTFINEGLAINSAVIDYAGKRAMLPWTLMSKRK